MSEPEKWVPPGLARARALRRPRAADPRGERILDLAEVIAEECRFLPGPTTPEEIDARFRDEIQREFEAFELSELGIR